MSFYSSDEENRLLKGIELCRDGHFFDAHDEWESVWQNLTGRKRIFWQSLIQFVIACYHAENNNQIGSLGMLNKAMNKAEILMRETNSSQIGMLLELYRQAASEFSANELNNLSDYLKDRISELITKDLLTFENDKK